MKLAEALAERGSLQKDLAWVKDQFAKIARGPEGGRPGENPELMLERMEDRSRRLEHLVASINITNLSVCDAGGRSMRAQGRRAKSDRAALHRAQSLLHRRTHDH